MTVSRVRGPRIGQVRHAELEDPPQSLELRGVEEFEEQRVERLLDLERDHVVHRVANDLLRHGRYYVQAGIGRHTDNVAKTMKCRPLLILLTAIAMMLPL